MFHVHVCLSVVWYRLGGRCQLKSPPLPFFFPAKKNICIPPVQGSAGGTSPLTMEWKAKLDDMI